MNYEKQRAWSDKFTNEAMMIIRSHQHLLPPPRFKSSISIASEMQDMRQATDAVVLQTGEICVALRVRRFNHLAKYRNEFTIRVKSRGGISELEKIKQGFCSVYFYGFANEYENGFAYWRLIDVNKFRKWINRMAEKGIQRPYSIIDNHDGTMGGVFKVRDSLADCIIVDSSTKESGQLTLL